MTSTASPTPQISSPVMVTSFSLATGVSTVSVRPGMDLRARPLAAWSMTLYLDGLVYKPESVKTVGNVFELVYAVPRSKSVVVMISKAPDAPSFLGSVHRDSEVEPQVSLERDVRIERFVGTPRMCGFSYEGFTMRIKLLPVFPHS